MPRRAAFFVSDRTGLTSENMGEALLDQFDNINFKRATFPFIDTTDKAHALVSIINQAEEKTGEKPLVFMSIIKQDICEIVKSSNGLHLNFFEAFLSKIEYELGVKARHSIGRSHSITDTERYDARMDAVNFSLNHDDGIIGKDLRDADVVLMGVSRSGKTPTCLYLALQYGIRAANYPLTPDDLQDFDLPRIIKPYRYKLFGLTIAPERLQAIRQERRPNSTYANINTCRREVREAQAMFRQHTIPYTNTTDKSVEELAIYIMQACQLKRRF